MPETKYEKHDYPWTPYKQIPNDYKITSIFPKNKGEIFDYNSIAYLSKLYENGSLKNGTVKEVDGKCIIENERLYNGCEYSDQLYHYLAEEYLNSARILIGYILAEREELYKGNIILSSYTNPCAFLCRHAIELKLKQCLCNQGFKEIKSHELECLWNKINKSKLDETTIQQINFFIEELSKIDPKGTSIRYGTQNLLPTDTPADYDCYVLVANTMYLFNQLHKIAF